MTTPAAGGNGQAPTADPGNGQAPTQGSNDPQQSASPPSGSQNGQAPAGNTDTYKPPSVDEWKRTQQEIAEARRDAAKYRDELKKRDDATLTEQQKRERDFSDMQAKVFEYEARHQQQALQIAGYRLGAGLGIGDIGAALALVQVEHGADVKYDAKTGEPENIADLLKAVLKDHPFLAAQAGAPTQPPATAGGATNPSRSGTNGGAKVPLTWDYIGELQTRNTQEYMARRDEILRWMQANAHSRPGR